jgi:hypothetical protein
MDGCIWLLLGLDGHLTENTLAGWPGLAIPAQELQFFFDAP